MLLSASVWHQAGSPDGIGWSGRRLRGCPVEIKCPFAPDNRTMSVKKYLQDHPAYLAQMQQYAYLLRADFVDFVRWSDVDERGRRSADGLGFVSILRYVTDHAAFRTGERGGGRCGPVRGVVRSTRRL